ncbi:uncharacterized protein N7515_005364 [Penicillium bovifimosum]|uniref:Uncharacterized protein n=1 Tax=Penicillium bovifimosum TaxID=126998 RepID=A0A9W9GSM9_9EURO|nr:uncharacterized protein N7515_005364 [Penicillium bovifimosum]KAJ5129325.1 hypothetical protein N7515_005364 [Penicillium bovifimosum]
MTLSSAAGITSPALAPDHILRGLPPNSASPESRRLGAPRRRLLRTTSTEGSRPIRRVLNRGGWDLVTGAISFLLRYMDMVKSFCPIWRVFCSARLGGYGRRLLFPDEAWIWSRAAAIFGESPAVFVDSHARGRVA